jgi:predicted nucleotidyltransferase
MNVLEKIKTEPIELKPELTKKYFVDRIGLFGSVTRNDFTENSDIDMIVEFNKPVGVEFIDLADFLESKFLRKIDLLSKKGVRANYFKMIEKDIVYV